MAQQRLVQLSAQRPTSTVCALGTELCVDVGGAAPKDAACFHAQGTAGVKLYVVHGAQTVKLPSSVSRWPLGAGVELLVAAEELSKDVGDEKVRVSYFGAGGGVPVGRAVLYITCVDVSLDADGSRSGVVSKTLADKRAWTWGPEGHGAILLVNCGHQQPAPGPGESRQPAGRTYRELKEASQVVLRARGPRAVFAGHRLVLHVSFGDADKLGVFHGANSVSPEEYKHVLGGEKLSYAVKPSRHQEENVFYVEGLRFPDVGFAGLLSLHATLLESPEQGLPETPVYTDTVVFRVAPWIATPNTLAPVELYVGSVATNQDFVAAVSALAERAGCPITVCPPAENRRDRWSQDEMEFGYVQAPHKTLPVVFDSPRGRGLEDFPAERILGPDVGYVAREGVSELDSFGNLEVSPPVTARGKEFPLGRVLVGSSFPRFGGRRMVKAVRDFVMAQEVQAPVELFSDWLALGHVNEFLTFVPAPDRQGFRLLLASPSACYRLLKEKRDEGYGKVVAFEGLKGVPKATVEELLADEALRQYNAFAQSCVSWNRDILKRELGLGEADIVDVPQLYMDGGDMGARAFFPAMVNMLVLGKYLGIPKPFGPVIGGRCCLEEKVRSLLEPLGLTCTFIAASSSSHAPAAAGCRGTNVRRQPFSFKWWHVVP
ncbi:protein-arginine deiminase type-1-like [Rhea pennata]|uniref:protein-arginine deiminase type-1-like n=1 Tax=Rhea pennata TaxID=8795 RepID=UPI002E261110